MRVRLTRTMGNREVGDTVDVTRTEAEWLRDRGYIASAQEVEDAPPVGDADPGSVSDSGSKGSERSKPAPRGRTAGSKG